MQVPRRGGGREGSHTTAFRACGRLAGLLALVMTCAVTHRAVAQDTGNGPALVTIEATDLDASEIGPDAGRFTFTRDGDATNPLTVWLSIGGLATNGSDYELIVDSVVFPAQATSATLVIRPLRDDVTQEGVEDVTLTIVPDVSYSLGEATATVWIEDNAVPPTCDQPSSTNCKNQWLIDAYIGGCAIVTDVCGWLVSGSTAAMSQACKDVCDITDAAYQRICNTTKATCGGVNTACTAFLSKVRDVCLATGVGTGCNAEDTACRAACSVTCTIECALKCIRPWKKKCKTCVSNCSSSCNGSCTNKRNACIESRCGSLDTDAECLRCDGSCKREIAKECGFCGDIEVRACLDICEQSAPPCIVEKQLGEECSWPECTTGLRCLPDLTSFEGLGPGALIEAILKSTDIESALENITAASGAGNIDLAELFCTNDNCRCREPLLDTVGEELDAQACMALYRPGRHLQAWLVNDAIAGVGELRQALSQQWQAAGMPADVAAGLLNRYEQVAFAYGGGGAAAAGAGTSAEVGTLYGPKCYGCYYTLCGSVTPDLNVNAYGTLGVYDASGDPATAAIKNLEGWSRVVQLGGSFPAIEVGASASFILAPPLGLNFEPKKVFEKTEWEVQIDALKTEFDSWKADAEQAASDNATPLFEEWVIRLFNQFIPTGRTGAVSIGLGINPVTVAGGLCYTWVRESLCLSDSSDDGGGQCLAGDIRIDVDEPLPDDVNDPPRAICRDRTVVAPAPPVCSVDTSVDWGSWDPEGPVTLTQTPPGPYDIGSTSVTLTASDGINSDACAATVTVEDRDPPELQCPPDAEYECQGNEQAFIDPGDATAVDCSTFDLADPGLAYYPLGTTDVVYSATDLAGNLATCTTQVTVLDTETPTIVCPDDRFVECDGAGNFAEIDAWLGAATATDGCGNVTIVNDFVELSDDCGMTGSASATWTATDDSGNTDSCSATFTIVDTMKPTLSCSAVVPCYDDDESEGEDCDDEDDMLLLEFGASDACSFGDNWGVIDIGCLEIPVVNGQVIELECEEGDDEQKAQKEHCEAEYEDGILEIEARTATLIVTSTDECNNTAICAVDLCAAVEHDDDEDDDDDDDSDDDDSDDDDD